MIRLTTTQKRMLTAAARHPDGLIPFAEAFGLRMSEMKHARSLAFMGYADDVTPTDAPRNRASYLITADGLAMAAAIEADAAPPIDLDDE